MVNMRVREYPCRNHNIFRVGRLCPKHVVKIFRVRIVFSAAVNYDTPAVGKSYDYRKPVAVQRTVVFGGKSAPDALKIEPTVMDKITFDDAVMQQEIFMLICIMILPVLIQLTSS